MATDVIHSLTLVQMTLIKYKPQKNGKLFVKLKLHALAFITEDFYYNLTSFKIDFRISLFMELP